MRMLRQREANATFLFSLGPDHTGWAMRRLFRSGFFQKISRTSIIDHYGLKTLMYGTLLPAPDIGRECADQMRAIRHAGFECGVHTWDHVLWQDNVRQRDAAWTQKLMQKSFDRFTQIFGHAPQTHGAAGWQMNEYAFSQLDTFDMPYASDGRALLTDTGTLANLSAGPHRLNVSGTTLSCIQLPTTLPTLDEMLGRTIDGITLNTTNIVQAILKLTETPRDHVYTLHAELEGQKLAPIFELLLTGWRAQGYDLVSMAEYHETIRTLPLPTYPVSWGTLPGRSGELIVQSA